MHISHLQCRFFNFPAFNGKSFQAKKQRIGFQFFHVFYIVTKMRILNTSKSLCEHKLHNNGAYICSGLAKIERSKELKKINDEILAPILLFTAIHWSQIITKNHSTPSQINQKFQEGIYSCFCMSCACSCVQTCVYLYSWFCMSCACCCV